MPKSNSRFSGLISAPSVLEADKTVKSKSSLGSNRPYFSFRFICTKDYCMKRCSNEQFKSLSDKLRILSELEWSQIDSSPRETNGYEMIPVSALSASVPDRFSDQEAVCVFRFGGKKGRIAGVKFDKNFYVLFIDRDFTLYEHG